MRWLVGANNGPMILYRFDASVGREIERFDSEFSLSGILALDSPARISFLSVPPGGRVGRHEATSDQLFLVVGGRGYVAGEDGVETTVQAGTGAYWARGERHHAGTDNGLTAIVIEGERLRPGDAMPAIPDQAC